MYLDNERRRRSPAARLPRGRDRRRGAGDVRDHLLPLWYLQVLSGDKYEAQAQNNRVREIKVQAPRGEIVDRHGQPLVENRNSLSIKVTPDKLPRTGRGEGLPAARCCSAEAAPLEKRVEGELKAPPFSKPTVKQDVPRAGGYVLERQERVPRRRAGASSCASTRTARRRAPVRPGRRERGSAQGRALQRRRDGRSRRPGRHRARVRPLPAGPKRRGAPRGGRARKPDEDAQARAADPGQAAAPRSTSTSSGWPSRRSRAAPARAPSRSWT